VQHSYVFRWGWHAYPQLPPMPDMIQQVHFELRPQLYYLNAMESIFSTIETEILSAFNIRNLLVTATKSTLK
jgi:prenylcysteine oxidase/farnesylcysteine lyase